MLEEFLNNPWAGAALWTALYISDYAFTLASARLYQAGGKDKICVEGSYEITPYYQNDIDSLRRLSPRFILALLVTLAGLFTLRWFTTVELYKFVLGAMILMELAIHVRHIRNLFLYRAIVATNTVKGRIEYPRPLMLKLSSLELLAFSVLFAFLFAYTPSWFVLGGVFSCLSLSVQHSQLARKNAGSHVS